MKVCTIARASDTGVLRAQQKMHNTTVVERDLNDYANNDEDNDNDDDADDTHLPWAQWTRTAFPFESSSNASLTVALNTLFTISIGITVVVIMEFVKRPQLLFIVII